MAEKNIPTNVNSDILGRMRKAQKILTSLNKIYSWRKPRLAREK